MIFSTGAFVKTFRALADGSISIQFETGELSPNELSDLGKCLKRSGVLVFKPDVTKLSSAEMKAIENTNIITEDGGKSPSVRLRSVLYRTFEKDHEGYENFDMYYISKMEKFINHCKTKLD